MLTSNNVNHTNCLDHIWDNEVEQMLGIKDMWGLYVVLKTQDGFLN